MTRDIKLRVGPDPQSTCRAVLAIDYVLGGPGAPYEAAQLNCLIAHDVALGAI
jgi:hypothetical protein